ncbi:hypothetical protein B0H11DRAFT_1911782 [Mycena galericulata]|nr:hypothetical protein B0H11DRAFT_1911782 [Mycena galericulata]
MTHIDGPSAHPLPDFQASIHGPEALPVVGNPILSKAEARRANNRVAAEQSRKRQREKSRALESPSSTPLDAWPETQLLGGDLPWLLDHRLYEDGTIDPALLGGEVEVETYHGESVTVQLNLATPPSPEGVMATRISEPKPVQTHEHRDIVKTDTLESDNRRAPNSSAVIKASCTEPSSEPEAPYSTEGHAQKPRRIFIGQVQKAWNLGPHASPMDGNRQNGRDIDGDSASTSGSRRGGRRRILYIGEAPRQGRRRSGVASP